MMAEPTTARHTNGHSLLLSRFRSSFLAPSPEAKPKHVSDPSGKIIPMKSLSALLCGSDEAMIRANGDTDVRFTGEDTKAKLYEPKNKKLIRLMTVSAYILAVSLAAIILSLFYVFMWDAKIRPPAPTTEVPLVATPSASALNLSTVK